MAVAAAAEQFRVYEEPELTNAAAWLPDGHIKCEVEHQVPLTDSAPSINPVRSPEAEIYGRSLSTIHRLGAIMVGKVASEIIHSPEAEQARAEFYTSVEEGFGTDMELGGGLEVRDFALRPVLGGKVMARDFKTAVSDMTEAGLACAEEKVKTETARGDHRFVPQFMRSKWDHKNALLVDEMVRGETDYNTRIVVSPFPEEAAARSGNNYWRDIGYVPHLKRGFVQVYYASEGGLVSGSLSFDGSDKSRLREIFGRFGVEIPETEITDNWLQYAITDTLSEDDAKALALEIADQAANPQYKKTTNTVDITGEHHKAVDTVFNESYIHACESQARGYQTPGARQLILQLAEKAGSFNSRYAGALYQMQSNEKKFSDDDMVVLHELLVYSTIEMMRALHTRSLEPKISVQSSFHERGKSDVEYLHSLDQASFQSILTGFGAEGARNNRTYSACGLSISLGKNDTSGANPQNEFGGQTETGDVKLDVDKYGSLEFDCPKCKRTNRRPRDKLIPHCQKCGADVTCG
jgi:hypothetical protein